MNRIIIVLLIAFITISIALAGIKKGDIQKDFHYDQTITKNININKLIEEYYGHYNGTNTWSEEFKNAMKQRALDLLNDNNINQIVSAEIFAALGVNGFVFNINPSQPQFDQFYFPGRETVGYVLASRDTNGSYFMDIAEGDVSIRIEGAISGEVKAKVTATHNISPLVIDLDQNNIIDTYNKSNFSKPVASKEDFQKRNWISMDILGDGVIRVVEKLGPNDGLLFTTNDINKIINRGYITGKELFGQSDGFKNGFEKMKLLDKDNNNIIEGKELNNVYVWQDKNQDGKVQENEILNSKDINLTRINLNYNSKMMSTATMNGKTTIVWDWYPATLDVKFSK
ncbi:MAG: hypothetical protein N2485_06760 [bacterium]|nr:hypothetical protein [bacterium]